jgi:hypothetical protein
MKIHTRTMQLDQMATARRRSKQERQFGNKETPSACDEYCSKENLRLQRGLLLVATHKLNKIVGILVPGDDRHALKRMHKNAKRAFKDMTKEPRSG